MGTWGHSTPGSYIIFDSGSHNVACAEWLKQQAISHKPLMRVCAGENQAAFIVKHQDFDRVQDWVQESVLLLGEADARDRRPALLAFRDGASFDLGLLYQCSRAAANARSSWMHDPMFDRYFITERDYRTPKPIIWRARQAAA